MKPSKTLFIPSLYAVVLTFILPLFGFALPQAQAATFTVTTTADSCPGSLRQAVTNANALAGDDLIDFSVTGTITLLSALPNLSSNITINGPGANVLTVQRSTASGTPDFGIFRISSGATVTISGLTLTRGTLGGIFNTGTTTMNNCTISGNSAIGGGGAGILNGGTLIVNRCGLTGNTVTDSLGRAGALYNFAGEATVNDSLILDNTASSGGALYNEPDGTLSLNRCTLSQNRAIIGGAIWNNGGGNGTGSLTITNSTLSGNRASNAAGGIFNFGSGSLKLISSTVTDNSATNGIGGIYNSSGTVNIGNSIIAGNSAPTNPDVAGTITSLDYNLIQVTGGANISGTTTHNITGLSPNLSPLQNNGGPMRTHALLLGSPAIDAGSCSVGGTTITLDQRGKSRPLDVSSVANAADGCDIGATEFDPMQAQTGTTLIVNTTDDLNDSACTFGHCSLREAINRSNGVPGANTIGFSIPATGVQRIAPTSALPTITDPVTINGYSQPGARANTLATGNNAVVVIELYGAALPPGPNGLTITAGNSTVQGLILTRFAGSAIALQTAGGNTIQGNFIGTNTSYEVLLANGNGVLIASNSNTVGGTTPAARNIISLNHLEGIVIRGVGANNNLVQGNFISTTRDGAGVRIEGGAQSNSIGGTAAGAGNVISSNRREGILIRESGTNGNLVQGNFIGTDVTGSAAIPNGSGGSQSGVNIRGGAQGNIIGGTTPGARNVISGNASVGVLIGFFEPAGTNGNVVQGNYIGTNAAGTAALRNGTISSGQGVRLSGDVRDNVIGGTAAGAGNLISGNYTGILIDGASRTSVQGNLIGTDATGTTRVGDANAGIQIVAGAQNNTIGGGVPGARNVISGHESGIRIADTATTGNSVQGNYIGTDVSGSLPLGNRDGVVIENAPGNTVGGTTTGARNVISGNGYAGVWISGSGATGNLVRGNLIGTDVTGTITDPDGIYNNGDEKGNGRQGVFISGAPGNTIGGTTAGARNVISGNLLSGIQIDGSGATGNHVQGNFIGTDVTGTLARKNDIGGVYISGGASNNTIGGTTSGARNLISGNVSTGVLIASSNNVVQGNFIGTDVTGTAALGNSVLGVYSQGQNNTIGGTAPGAGNVIAFNGENGVMIRSGTGNAIRGNSIHSNIGIGINLQTTDSDNTVTPNDPGDGDSGANTLQNFPVLTAVTVAGATTTIDGTLDSLPNMTFTLDFYRSPSADASGYGEGEVYLGSANVTTTGSGPKSFSIPLATAVPSGEFVSATATDPSGNTSEFSQSRRVNRPPTDIALSPGSVDENSANGTVVGTLSTTDSDSGETFTYALLDDAEGRFSLVDNEVRVANGTLLNREANASHVITVRSTDSGGATFEKSLTITVNNVNETPAAANDAYSVNEDTTLMVAAAGVLSNDTDPDGTALTAVVATNPSHGSLTLNANGSFTYAPQAEFTGSDSFTYRASDGTLNSDPATVTITVQPLNDAPVLNPSGNPLLGAIMEDAPPGNGTLVTDLISSVVPLDMITDADSGALEGLAIRSAETSNGAWQFSLNGGSTWTGIGAVSDGGVRLLAADSTTRIRFVPSANFSGTASLSFRAWDRTRGANGGLALATTNGGTTAFSAATETAAITVGSVNDNPLNVSLNPGTGSQVVGVSRTYTSKYLDADGIADMAEARILVNSSLNGANGLHGMYVLATNKLYLRDNVNGSWLGGFAPLSNNIISNSQGSLNCALTSVGGNGNTLTVNWNFTPATIFMGGKYIYMMVRDKSNVVDGWEQMGTVQIVANKAPINHSLSPNSGSSAAGAARTLTTKYLDENGSEDIAEARLLVNSAANGAGALLAMYTPANNKLFLRDNVNGSWLGGFAPGSNNVISNSQGSLNCAGTTVTFGAQILTINWNFTPAANFTGIKNLYLLVRDRSNAVDGLEPLGTWTITGDVASAASRATTADATSPVVLSSATASASSQSVTLTFTSALDAVDATHYAVQVNGQMAPVVSAVYSAGTNAVTLSLAPGTLRARDTVIVSWTNLRDVKGAWLSGQAGLLTTQ